MQSKAFLYSALLGTFVPSLVLSAPLDLPIPSVTTPVNGLTTSCPTAPPAFKALSSVSSADLFCATALGNEDLIETITRDGAGLTSHVVLSQITTGTTTITGLTSTITAFEYVFQAVVIYDLVALY